MSTSLKLSVMNKHKIHTKVGYLEIEPRALGCRMTSFDGEASQIEVYYTTGSWAKSIRYNYLLVVQPL